MSTLQDRIIFSLIVSLCLKACLEYFFSTESYHFDVKENEPTGFKIGILDIKDLDEKQNKNPIFTVDDSHKDIFEVELNSNNDGVLTLKKVVFASSCPPHVNHTAFSIC